MSKKKNNVLEHDEGNHIEEKELEENTDNNESEKQTSEDKKWRIIGIVFVGLILLVLFIKLVSLEKKLPKSDINYDNSIYNLQTVRGEGYINSNILVFKCALTDENGSEKISEVEKYGVGDYLLCDTKIVSSYTKQIDNLSFEFISNNIELLKLYTISDVWEVKKTDSSTENGNISISIATNGKNSNDNLSDVKFLLHIKNNENNDKSFKINFNNIKIHTIEDATYKTKDMVVEFNTGESRYYYKNDVIIFEKMQDDGSFKKTNEYKCNTVDSCIVNLAAQNFVYQNDNSNIVMIYDKDSKDMTVLFDIEKGIIDTYGGRPSWLYTANSTQRVNTYIYIMAKDSDKFGIIDVNGKIIHEFNLGNINANIPSGILYSVYSIENDMIVDQRNDKYGITKITSSDTIIDYKFKSIRLVNNKYFKAKSDGKWYLYSFDTKDKVIEDGYDELFVVNDEIIIVEKDKYLYIKDYNGNNIVEDKIEDLSKEYFEYVCCGSNPGIDINIKDDIITITTYKDNDWLNYNQYEYSISSKVLTKKK